jgi:prolyl-tRNA synthetase
MLYTTFLNLLKKYKLYDDYDIKGCYIYDASVNYWLNTIESEWRKINGVSPICVPTLIKKEMIKKEIDTFLNSDSSHIFFTENYILKPTSEVALYTSKYFKNKIKTENDLPTKFYMYNKVYRKEDRSQPLIRDSEILGFSETHEVYVLEADVKHIAKEWIKKYKKLMEILNVPYVCNRRFDDDKFSGAEKTYAFDTLIDTKKLQLATVHNLGTNWSKLYEFKYISSSGIKKYPILFCAGHSERLLLAMLYHHSTIDGLKLPAHLRCTEVIFCDQIPEVVKEYSIYFDIIHSINEKNLKAHLVRAKWKDSIICIFKSKYDNVRVIDRNNTYYFKKWLIKGYEFKKKYKEVTNYNHRELFKKVEYTKDNLQLNNRIGYSLNKRYIYLSESF